MAVFTKACSVMYFDASMFRTLPLVPGSVSRIRSSRNKTRSVGVDGEINEFLTTVQRTLDERPHHVPCILILKVRSAWGKSFIKMIARWYMDNYYLSYTLDLSTASRDVILIYSIQLGILPTDESAHTCITKIVCEWIHNSNWKRKPQVEMRLLATISGYLMFLFLSVDVEQKGIINDACRGLLSKFAPNVVRRILYIVKPLHIMQEVSFGEVKSISDVDPDAVLRPLEDNRMTGMKGILTLRDLVLKAQHSMGELVEACANPARGFHTVPKSSMCMDQSKINRKFPITWRIKEEIRVAEFLRYTQGMPTEDSKGNIGCDALMMEDPLAMSKDSFLGIQDPGDMMLSKFMYWLMNRVLALPELNPEMASRILKSHATDFYEKCGAKGWKRMHFTSKTELLTWFYEKEFHNEAFLVDWPVMNEASGIVLATSKQLEYIRSRIGTASRCLQVLPDESAPSCEQPLACATSDTAAAAEAMNICQEIQQQNAQAQDTKQSQKAEKVMERQRMQQQVLSKVNKKQEALQYSLTTPEDLSNFCTHAANRPK